MVRGKSYYKEVEGFFHDLEGLIGDTLKTGMAKKYIDEGKLKFPMAHDEYYFSSLYMVPEKGDFRRAVNRLEIDVIVDIKGIENQLKYAGHVNEVESDDRVFLDKLTKEISHNTIDMKLGFKMGSSKVYVLAQKRNVKQKEYTPGQSNMNRFKESYHSGTPIHAPIAAGKALWIVNEYDPENPSFPGAYGEIETQIDDPKQILKELTKLKDENAPVNYSPPPNIKLTKGCLKMMEKDILNVDGASMAVYTQGNFKSYVLTIPK